MKKLILDVDTGVDDAMAIMVAMAAKDVQILAITCSHGNTSLDNSLRNTDRVLNVCNRLDVLVFPGSAEPIQAKKWSAGEFHGKDGLGDVLGQYPPSNKVVQEENAAQAINRIVSKHPNEVILVAMAPLTNLALAFKLDPSLPSKLKSLYIMGGNTEARGNTTNCGEFNFVADPEAAFIVLDKYTCPTYIATWEFTCRNSLPWSFCDTWLTQDTEKARFIEKISHHTRQMAKTTRYQKEFVAESAFNTCDAYAVAAAIDHTLLTDSEKVAVTVELNGTHTRGMMVLDRLDLLKKKHQATLMLKFDLKKYEEMLMKSLQ